MLGSEFDWGVSEGTGEGGERSRQQEGCRDGAFGGATWRGAEESRVKGIGSIPETGIEPAGQCGFAPASLTSRVFFFIFEEMLGCQQKVL
jgi:hypothetical protein